MERSINPSMKRHSTRARLGALLIALTVAATAAIAPLAEAAGGAFGIAFPIQSDDGDWHTVDSFAFYGGNVVWVGDVGVTHAPAVGHFAFVDIPDYADSTVTQASLRFTAANSLDVAAKTPLRFVITSDQECESAFKPGEGGFFPPLQCNLYELELSSWVQGTTYEVDVTSAVQRMMQEPISPRGRTTFGGRSIEFQVILLTGGSGPAVQIVAHDSDPANAADLAINWN